MTECGNDVTEADIPAALEIVFTRERKGFEKTMSLLTPLQLRVLRGLAAYSEARVYSAEFLRKVGMANAGAVRKALKRLEDLDIIYMLNKNFRFGDSFFRQWVIKTT